MLVERIRARHAEESAFLEMSAAVIPLSPKTQRAAPVRSRPLDKTRLQRVGAFSACA